MYMKVVAARQQPQLDLVLQLVVANAAEVLMGRRLESFHELTPLQHAAGLDTAAAKALAELARAERLPRLAAHPFFHRKALHKCPELSLCEPRR